jgi:hypothetical protein
MLTVRFKIKLFTFNFYGNYTFTMNFCKTWNYKIVPNAVDCLLTPSQMIDLNVMKDQS